MLQALIKAYGRQRLREIEDHKRKKLQARIARRQANSNPTSASCSPVHEMVSASTDLLQRVLQLGRKHSLSADNLTVLGRRAQGSGTGAGAAPGDDLLQRVLQLRRDENALRLNILQRPEPYPTHLRPHSYSDLQSAVRDQNDDDNDSDSTTTSGNASPRESPSRSRPLSPRDVRGWAGLRKRSADGDAPRSVSHRGNVYQAVHTEVPDINIGEVDLAEDKGDPDPDHDPDQDQSKESMTPVSCDQVAVMIDTEESDLETPGSADPHVCTPLLTKPEPGSEPEKSGPRGATSTSAPLCSPPPMLSPNTLGYQQLSSSDADADSVMASCSSTNPPSAVNNNKPPWGQHKADSADSTASSTATVVPSMSYENPSYSDVIAPDDQLESSAAPCEPLTPLTRPSTLPLHGGGDALPSDSLSPPSRGAVSTRLFVRLL